MGHRLRFPPAGGVSLALLESSIDVGVAPWSARADVGLLELAMQPRRLMRHVGPVLGAELVASRASSLSRAVVVDWLSLHAGAGLLSGHQGRSWATLTVGLTARSQWRDLGRGATFGAWVGAPLRLEAATHTDGRLTLGIHGYGGVVPAVGAGGNAVWAEARGQAWVYLGEARMTAVKLVGEARQEWAIHGVYQALEPVVSAGLRFERQ